MTIERWLDHHTEAALEDLAYAMNELRCFACTHPRYNPDGFTWLPCPEHDEDFLPLGKVQG